MFLQGGIFVPYPQMRKEKLGAGNRLLKKDLRQDRLAELSIESEQNSTGNVQKELTDRLLSEAWLGMWQDQGMTGVVILPASPSFPVRRQSVVASLEVPIWWT